MNRIDGRTANQLRPLTITKDYIKHAEGSVLVEMGDTKVIVTASVEDRVPLFKKGSGEGWLTAEYAMLPRATQARNQRDISKLKLNGRSGEIQRLIGRALRACIDLTKIGERTITVDCDVIQADGGTRTTSIIGGYVAVCSAMEKCMQQGLFETNPMLEPVAAISVGIVQGVPMLDLCYQEDSTADVDMNVVMNGQGRFIEVQGTGEHNTFTTEELQALLALAQDGIAEIVQVQKEALQA